MTMFKTLIGILIIPNIKSATAKFAKITLVTVCNFSNFLMAVSTRIFAPTIRKNSMTYKVIAIIHNPTPNPCDRIVEFTVVLLVIMDFV